MLALLSLVLAAAPMGGSCSVTGVEPPPPGLLFAPGQSLAFGHLSLDVMGPTVTAVLPFGEWQQHAALSLSAAQVDLSVELLPERPFEVLLRRAVRFGVLVERPGEWARVMEGGRASVVLEVTAPPVFRPRAPPRATVNCALVTLDRARVESARAERGTGRAVELSGGVEHAVRETPGGPVVGDFFFEGTEVLEERARNESAVKVRWSDGQVAVEGWVAAAEARSVGDSFGSGVGVLAGKRSVDLGVSDSSMIRCKRAVPLSVRSGGRIVEAGTLHQGIAFVVGEVTAEGAVISLEVNWVKLLPGATWMLSPKAWAECRR